MIDRSTVEGWKNRRGKSELLKALDGQTLTARQAINAKCYECTCGYDDGGQDCGLTTCPLYCFMPFRKGGVAKRRTLSVEQRAKLREQLQRKSKSSAGEPVITARYEKTQMGL